jgi:glutathione-regulated potassium-efflux system ancillary protein KefG
MKNRILLLFAHPRYEDSLVNKSLAEAAQSLSFVTFRDLYEIYPDFDIRIKEEQRLLLEHDIIIWHHPIYWYSCPPLLKQWIDLVLEYGWAYGKGGDKLAGKMVFNTVTAGGSKEVYHREGRNRFTLPEFLRPFDQTAHLCKMVYLPPFVVHHANTASREVCSSFGESYRNILTRLHQNTADVETLRALEYLNIHQYKNTLT